VRLKNLKQNLQRSSFTSTLFGVKKISLDLKRGEKTKPSISWTDKYTMSSTSRYHREGRYWCGNRVEADLFARRAPTTPRVHYIRQTLTLKSRPEEEGGTPLPPVIRAASGGREDQPSHRRRSRGGRDVASSSYGERQRERFSQWCGN
jgi:hypothetical protein